jgi:hypothetical protein
MFKPDIELIENETEGVGPSPSDQKNVNGLEETAISPAVSGKTKFQEFAAGAAYATPSGLVETGPKSKKKPGRPRKHPKKNSSTVDHSRALAGGSLDEQLTQQQKPEKKFVSLIEITAPGIRILGAVVASHMGSKHWSLTKEESEEIAKSLDKVANEFIPDMENIDPKTAAVIGLGMTIVSIYAGKSQSIVPQKSAEIVTETVTLKPDEPAQPAPTVAPQQAVNGVKFGMGPLG